MGGRGAVSVGGWVWFGVVCGVGVGGGGGVYRGCGEGGGGGGHDGLMTEWFPALN